MAATLRVGSALTVRRARDPALDADTQLSKRRAMVAPMANNRPPTTHSLLTAAYSGFPNATPAMPMTKLVPAIRRSLYDLKRDGVAEHRIGGSYMEIAQGLVARSEPWPIQADFQRAIDLLEAQGEVDEVQTDRGICYSLTGTGELSEEAARVPWWREQLRAAAKDAVDILRQRLVAGIIGLVTFLLGLGAGHFLLPK